MAIATQIVSQEMEEEEEADSQITVADLQELVCEPQYANIAVMGEVSEIFCTWNKQAG